MRAGPLDSIITILHHKVERDEFGAQVDTYMPKCNTRADVIDNSGGMKDENGEHFYQYTKQFYIRRYVPVCEFDRVLYRDKQWTILSISDDRIINQKILTCEQVNE